MWLGEEVDVDSEVYNWRRSAFFWRKAGYAWLGVRGSRYPVRSGRRPHPLASVPACLPLIGGILNLIQTHVLSPGPRPASRLPAGHSIHVWTHSRGHCFGCCTSWPAKRLLSSSRTLASKRLSALGFTIGVGVSSSGTPNQGRLHESRPLELTLR